MTIAICSIGLGELESLLGDPTRLGRIPVVPGALPPEFILEDAVAALRKGRPSIWYSPFAFIRSDPAQIVGTGGFKGLPAIGRIEIGYGVAESCRGRGIATAAVKELCALAFCQPGVTEIYAESATGNRPSRRVLEKTKFRHVGERQAEAGLVDRWIFAK
jgi:RimJ/RimL family protein N-acetyltransferase